MGAYLGAYLISYIVNIDILHMNDMTIRVLGKNPHGSLAYIGFTIRRSSGSRLVNRLVKPDNLEISRLSLTVLPY